MKGGSGHIIAAHYLGTSSGNAGMLFTDEVWIQMCKKNQPFL